ncbi:MAG: hypothetical protein WBN34_07690 [Woeseia sp.]
MDKTTLHTKFRGLVTGLLFIGLCSGCAQVREWMQLDSRGSGAGGVILGAPAPEQYLDEMYQLATGDPATQAEIYADAEAAATLTPGAATRMRLALILSVPGHAQSDLERAQDLFRDLLSQSELLTSTEISLATIHLREVEQRLQLARETERLRAESVQLASSERRAVERRLLRSEEENRQLRQALAEAEQKLEAITTIERSIREQAGNAQTPQ